MGRWPVLLACSLLFLNSSAAQSRQRSGSSGQLPAYFKAFQSYDEEGGLTRVVFKNGLTVIVEEYPSTPLVAVVTHVKLGPVGDVSPEVVARFLERPFREANASMGGFGEVRTGFRESLFASVVPAEKILDVLENHVDLLTPRDYDGKTLEMLANGIVHERKIEARVKPRTELLLEKQYFGMNGPKPVVPSREKYLEFYQTHYQPKNLILAISGSARSEQILSELVRLLAGKAEVKATGRRIPARELVSPSGVFTYRHSRGEVRKPLILAGYRVPGLGHKDYPAIKLLEYVLGKGTTALFNSSHEDEGSNAFLARVSLERAPVGEVFLISLVAEPTEVDRAEIRILAMIEALKKTPLPPLLMSRAKSLMLTDYYDALSQLDRRAYSLVFAEVSGALKTRNGLPRILAEISPDDVKAVVNKYFSRERLTIIEFFPSSAEERTFSQAAFEETLGILVPGEIRNQNSVIEIFRTEEEKHGFHLPDFRPSYSERELKRTSILRGPEIYVKEEHSMPLVHLGLFFPGGRINEVTSNAGITRLMLRAVLKNYIRRGGLLAASRLESLGVRISLVNRPDYFGLQAIVLSPDLNEGIWELLRWLRSPEVEEVDVELARAELLRELSLESADPLLESARRTVYGDHPYSFSVDLERDNLVALKSESVAAWKEQYLDRVNPHIIVLGDVEGTAFVSDLVSELSDRRYRVGAVSERAVPVPEDPTSAYEVVTDPELGRAIMVYPGPEEGSDFTEMLDVAMRILTSPIGLLTQEFCNERHLVDRIRLKRESGVEGGLILLEVTAPSNLSQSVTEIRQWLNRFSENSVPESLFFDSLVARISEYHYRRQARTDYLFEIMRSVLAGEPTDYGERYILNVRQLRLGEIVLAVQRYLGEEQ